MPRRRCAGVDEIGVVVGVPSVQLEKQLTGAPNSIVHVAMAVIRKRVAAEQVSIPAAARPDVAHCDERLGSDGERLRWQAHEALLSNPASPLG